MRPPPKARLLPHGLGILLPGLSQTVPVGGGEYASMLAGKRAGSSILVKEYSESEFPSQVIFCWLDIQNQHGIELAINT